MYGDYVGDVSAIEWPISGSWVRGEGQMIHLLGCHGGVINHNVLEARRGVILAASYEVRWDGGWSIGMI